MLQMKVSRTDGIEIRNCMASNGTTSVVRIKAKCNPKPSAYVQEYYIVIKWHRITDSHVLVVGGSLEDRVRRIGPRPTIVPLAFTATLKRLLVLARVVQAALSPKSIEVIT